MCLFSIVSGPRKWPKWHTSSWTLNPTVPYLSQYNNIFGRKLPIFIPHLYLTSCSAGPVEISPRSLCGKTRIIGLVSETKTFYDTLSRFDTTPACDGRADERTDRRTRYSRVALCIQLCYTCSISKIPWGGATFWRPVERTWTALWRSAVWSIYWTFPTKNCYWLLSSVSIIPHILITPPRLQPASAATVFRRESCRSVGVWLDASVQQNGPMYSS